MQSYPLRVRGLKHIQTFLCLNKYWSYPLRVHGLKPSYEAFVNGLIRVSFTGTWVETPLSKLALLLG